MTRDKTNKCILRCCQVYPFKIHEIEYASKAEFNDAVDRGKVKFICSKNPDHARAHFYTGDVHGAKCLDCMKEYNAVRRGKK